MNNPSFADVTTMAFLGIAFVTVCIAGLRWIFSLFDRTQIADRTAIEEQIRTLKENDRDLWVAMEKLRENDSAHITKDDLKDVVVRFEKAIQNLIERLDQMSRNGYRA